MFEHIKQYFKKLIPHLPPDGWKAFEDTLVVKQYAKGEIISEPGKTNSVVNFISEGAVFVYNYADDKRKIYNFFFEHEFTGDYESFLTRQPAKYGLEAIEGTTTLNLHYDSLQDMYTRYPEFERAGRLIAEAQFLRLTERNASLLAEKPDERYEKLIRHKPEVMQRVPQYHIASYLGVTPEALSRIRKRTASRSF